MTKNAFRQVRGGGGLGAELLRQPLQVCTMHRGEEPPEPAGRWLRCPSPAARGQRRLRRRNIQQDGSGHQGQCREPLTTFWRKDALTRRSYHLFRGQGQPFHRPAIAGEGLEMSARQRQRGVQEEGLVKARSMDQRGAEGWCTRSCSGPYQVVPKRRVQGQRGWPAMALPGCVALRWRCGNRAALVGAREGADQRTADGFAPFPWRGWERRPSRRAVDRSADDRALDARLLELAEGKTAITAERFVDSELRVGTLEEAELSVGFAGIGRLAPDEEAGHGQTLGPDWPNACRDAQRESG